MTPVPISSKVQAVAPVDINEESEESKNVLVLNPLHEIDMIPPEVEAPEEVEAPRHTLMVQGESSVSQELSEEESETVLADSPQKLIKTASKAQVAIATKAMTLPPKQWEKIHHINKAGNNFMQSNASGFEQSPRGGGSFMQSPRDGLTPADIIMTEKMRMSQQPARHKTLKDRLFESSLGLQEEQPNPQDSKSSTNKQKTVSAFSEQKPSESVYPTPNPE